MSIEQDVSIITDFITKKSKTEKIVVGSAETPTTIVLNGLSVSEILRNALTNFHHIKYIRTNNGKFRDTNINLSAYACQLRINNVSNGYVTTTNNDVLLEGAGSSTNATNSFTLKLLSLLLSDNTMISTLIFNQDSRLNEILMCLGIEDITVSDIYNQLMASMDKFMHRDISSDTQLPQVYVQNNNGDKVMLHILPNSSVAMRVAKELKYYQEYNFDNEANFEYNFYNTIRRNFGAKPNLVANLLTHTTLFTVSVPYKNINNAKQISNVFKYGIHVSVQDMSVWRKAILELVEVDTDNIAQKKEQLTKAIAISNKHFKDISDIINGIKSQNVSGWTDKYTSMKSQKYLLDSKYEEVLTVRMYNRVIRAIAEDFVDWFEGFHISEGNCSPRCLNWVKKKFIKYFAKY